MGISPLEQREPIFSLVKGRLILSILSHAQCILKELLREEKLE